MDQWKKILKKILKKYKKLKNVKFISKQKQENLKYFYNNSDIFVLYSLEEGLSMVQAQAMACGLPIICSENTGGSEIVDHGINGYVIPIKNIEILKNKIQEFYNDKSKLKNFSLNALKKTKELSWENYGKKLINTYRSILEKKKKMSKILLITDKYFKEMGGSYVATSSTAYQLINNNHKVKLIFFDNGISKKKI